MQIILQAAHGVVSGEPEFYKTAFGATHEEFEEILSRPHHMIFNRQWYELYDGRAEFDEYHSQFNRLSASERAELLQFLSGRNPAEFRTQLTDLPKSLQRVAQFYIPISKQRESEIRKLQSSRIRSKKNADIRLTSEEFIEDAGLLEEDV